jgi:hypothetical protein
MMKPALIGLIEDNAADVLLVNPTRPEHAAHGRFEALGKLKQSPRLAGVPVAILRSSPGKLR